MRFDMPVVKVAGYGRCSTDKQQLSPKVQEDKIRRWFEYQKESGRWPDGAELIGMFVDEAVSSRIDMLNREQGYNLLVSLDPGDVIVCATMSRAFRSAGDAEKTTNTLQEAGISLQFVDCAVDTSTPQGKMFLGMIAVMARFEREMIAERTRDAMRIKRINGELLGPPPYGWKAKDGTNGKVLVPDINRRIVALAARKLFMQGLSRSNIERQMRYFTNKHNMKVPRSISVLTVGAAMAALDFPKTSHQYCRKLLGMKILRQDFICLESHEDIKEKLRIEAEKEGLVLWATVNEND